MARAVAQADLAEEQALADDLAAQERGPADTSAPAYATDYVHATTPEGVDVVFCPGEALPPWAR